MDNALVHLPPLGGITTLCQVSVLAPELEYTHTVGAHGCPLPSLACLILKCRRSKIKGVCLLKRWTINSKGSTRAGMLSGITTLGLLDHQSSNRLLPACELHLFNCSLMPISNQPVKTVKTAKVSQITTYEIKVCRRASLQQKTTLGPAPVS